LNDKKKSFEKLKGIRFRGIINHRLNLDDDKESEKNFIGAVDSKKLGFFYFGLKCPNKSFFHKKKFQILPSLFELFLNTSSRCCDKLLGKEKKIIMR